MSLEKDVLIHNRYRIVEILGQGGMGSVYRVVDENLGTSMALKENLFTTDEYSRQFRLEAVILANLRHPNLPRVSDHFVLGDQGQYLVMDFIEGEDLRFRMERLGMLNDDDAVHIGAAICDALAYLHTRKPPILHRDIKPGNVKITSDGHIYLVDFGLAKVYQSASQATTTGARAMTPGYSPPEQYGTARTDPRTDIYSLGATLYAALSGVIPEDGLARAMDNAQLTPLRKRNSKVSRKLAAAIEKAMAVDPIDRFQSAEEFKKALLSAKSITQQAPGAYTVAPPPPEAMLQSSMQDTIIEDEPLKPARTPKKGIVAAPATHEDQPFVSPLKKQKQRERRQRANLIRFIFLLALLTLAGILYLAPGLLPSNLREMLPAFMGMPTNTSIPSPQPTAPPATLTPATTTTATTQPTNTPFPTHTSSPMPTNTLIPGVEQTFTPTATSIPTQPIFVGGGAGQIAFASTRTGVSQIYLSDLSAENALQITNIESGACQPTWSPDGQRIMFISPCKSTEDIYYNTSLFIINADGTGLTVFDASPGGNFDPAWSPDGTSVAFTSLRTGQMEIFVASVDDPTSAVQLTKGTQRTEARMPSWSPDGTQLVYATKRVGVYQIWKMNSDGSDQKQIIRSGQAFNDYSPAWSPNGDLILFNQRCATAFCNPYLMSTSASNPVNEQGLKVQINLVFVEHVDYSPDGFYLTYEGIGDAGNLDVFYMTVSGGNRIRLTTDENQDFHPTWRPAITTP
jgi:eukaryotic-like serine/threonine-protein kinase